MPFNMPLPRVSPRSFLSAARSALQNAVQHSLPVTFVVGNESADLDSVCSAIVLAYLKTYAPFSSSPSKSNTLYIPLSNLPRADLSLRPELLPVLSHANLKPSDLITLSDLPSTSTSAQYNPRIAPERTRWILVDHNALQGELGKLYSASVRGCIDHHDEEHRVPSECGDEPRIVGKSGSCATLVVEYCRQAWDDLARGSANENETAKWNVELARLALAPVLMDTTNLSIPSRTTDVDREAANYLRKVISMVEGNEFSSDRYFEEISQAKEDISGLSLPDFLRKDYKQWSEGGSFNLGISSVVKNITFMIEKAGNEDNFFTVHHDFAMERDLDICSVMTTSHEDGVFKRELLIWGLNAKGVYAAKKFEEGAKEKLGLEVWNQGSLDLSEEGSWRRCWWQQNVDQSRKQVAPLLRASI